MCTSYSLMVLESVPPEGRVFLAAAPERFAQALGARFDGPATAIAPAVRWSGRQTHEHHESCQEHGDLKLFAEELMQAVFNWRSWSGA